MPFHTLTATSAGTGRYRILAGTWALHSFASSPPSQTPGRLLNLHKTWIKPDATGHKAFDHLPKNERPQARLVLKNHTTVNGCIRLWPDCEIATRLTVGEGVESCLAAARTHRPAWSCLNAGNLKALPVLAGIEALTIACDHDPAGIAAAREVGARWRAGRARCPGPLSHEPENRLG